MPTVSEVARVSLGHRPVPTLAQHGSDDPTMTRGWLLHTAMIEQGSRVSPADLPASLTFPIPDGYVAVEGIKASHIARDLYPTEINWSDPVAVGAFMSPIYNALRSTGNARVVWRNPLTGRTVWALRPEWSTDAQPAWDAASRSRVRRAKAVAKRRKNRLVEEKRGVYEFPYIAMPDGTFTCRECGFAGRSKQSVNGHFGVKHRRDAAKPAPVVEATPVEATPVEATAAVTPARKRMGRPTVEEVIRRKAGEAVAARPDLTVDNAIAFIQAAFIDNAEIIKVTAERDAAVAEVAKQETVIARLRAALAAATAID